MSSRLSDLVAKAMKMHTAGGRCDMALAAKALVESFEAEHIDRAKYHFANKQIRLACGRIIGAAANEPAAQGELPLKGLHVAYAVSLDREGGARRMVRTYDLSRHEASAALQIRNDQLKADEKSRDLLARAIAAAEPYWDAKPDLTLGQALERAARDQAVA